MRHDRMDNLPNYAHKWDLLIALVFVGYLAGWALGVW